MRHAIARSLLAIALLACTPLLAHAKCDDPPAPKVDWDGCDGKGAILRGANLASADLKGADLGLAIWIDGKRRCASGAGGEAGSIGTCN